MPDDIWRWRVHYNDGTTLEEYDADGTDHGFAEVRLPDVLALEVYPASPDAHLAQQIVLIDAANAQRPIFFRRRQQLLTFDSDGELDTTAPRRMVTTTVLGWQQTLSIRAGRKTIARNVAHYTALFDDGSSFMTNSREVLDLQLHAIASRVFQPALDEAAAPAIAEEAEAVEALPASIAE